MCLTLLLGCITDKGDFTLDALFLLKTFTTVDPVWSLLTVNGYLWSLRVLLDLLFYYLNLLLDHCYVLNTCTRCFLVFQFFDCYCRKFHTLLAKACPSLWYVHLQTLHSIVSHSSCVLLSLNLHQVRVYRTPWISLTYILYEKCYYIVSKVAPTHQFSAFSFCLMCSGEYSIHEHAFRWCDIHMHREMKFACMF